MTDLTQWTRVTTGPDLEDIETYVREYRGHWLQVQKGRLTGKYWAFLGTWTVGRPCSTVLAAQQAAEHAADKQS